MKHAFLNGFCITEKNDIMLFFKKSAEISKDKKSYNVFGNRTFAFLIDLKAPRIKIFKILVSI
jgi:hypothetical protein